MTMNEAIKWLTSLQNFFKEDSEQYVSLGMAIEVLKQPEIIRCKDCKYRGKMACPFGIRQMPRDNDFCFYGKRRGEEE